MKKSKNIAIIGGGPCGLIAAEILADSGCIVTIYDRMPSLGRKLLMAGRGGLNLTHSEALERLINRYGAASGWLAPHINAFTPDDLRKWCEGLGQETFIGSSGRVFPKIMKAAPLLRAWLGRLNKLGVQYKTRHHWQGWEGEALKFINEGVEVFVKHDATLLALGGASWPRLGSDGGWVKILESCGVEISPLRPSNCGFVVDWSEYFSSRFAGSPLKSVSITYKNILHNGELMITAQGLEGGAVYALSANLREEIIASGFAVLNIDLRPNMTVEDLANKLQTPRGNQSFSNYLRKAGFSKIQIGLLREITSSELLAKSTPFALANIIKKSPVKLTATTGIARAISTAGGISRSSLDDNFMLVAKPYVFAAGEMLDWEAPTGGYLLQGCFSTGIAAAKGIISRF